MVSSVSWLDTQKTCLKLTAGERAQYLNIQMLKNQVYNTTLSILDVTTQLCNTAHAQQYTISFIVNLQGLRTDVCMACSVQISLKLTCSFSWFNHDSSFSNQQGYLWLRQQCFIYFISHFCGTNIVLYILQYQAVIQCYP